MAQGAEPLLFLDYYATGKLDVDTAARVVAGIAEGCRQAGAALVGGETAEMPGMYGEGDYDLAGFCVGAVNRDGVLPRLEAQRPGDLMIALAASGPHSNGYSLIRKVVDRSGLPWTAPAPFAPGRTLGEAFMTPTQIYVKSVLPLAKSGKIKGVAHITGGGLIENPPRALAEGLTAPLRLDRLGPAPGLRLAPTRRRRQRPRTAPRLQLRHRPVAGGVTERCARSALRPTRGRRIRLRLRGSRPPLITSPTGRGRGPRAPSRVGR